jgi:beta-N-acetylhexosaminidase
MAAPAPRALFLGCAGTDLSADEVRFFADADPAGFILFKRNCQTSQQVRELVAGLRAAIGRPEAPVLIDQEGGRVVRMGPPVWRAPPAPAVFGTLAAVDEPAAVRAAWLNARLIAADLVDVGITVNCAPTLDLRFAGASKVVGDRALGSDPVMVATLGRAVADGLLAGGVLPVPKHMPGHGRATADSHASMPQVDTPLADLEAMDFAPFRALRDLPLGIPAHVCYTAIDTERPGSLSPIVIGDVLRGTIGFDGLLITDDLSMGALTGSIGERAAAALAAGCDIALHCNGARAEMESAVAAVPRLAGAAQERFDRAFAVRPDPEPFDPAAALGELDGLLDRVGAT